MPETKRGIRPDDLFKIAMLGDVAVSPDGGAICFVQTKMDRESNAYRSDLWIVPSAGMVGEATQFTHGRARSRSRAGRRTGAGSPSWPIGRTRGESNSGSSRRAAWAAKPAR